MTHNVYELIDALKKTELVYSLLPGGALAIRQQVGDKAHARVAEVRFRRGQIVISHLAGPNSPSVAGMEKFVDIGGAVECLRRYEPVDWGRRFREDLCGECGEAPTIPDMVASPIRCATCDMTLCCGGVHGTPDGELIYDGCIADHDCRRHPCGCVQTIDELAFDAPCEKHRVTISPSMLGEKPLEPWMLPEIKPTAGRPPGVRQEVQTVRPTELPEHEQQVAWAAWQQMRKTDPGMREDILNTTTQMEFACGLARDAAIDGDVPHARLACDVLKENCQRLISYAEAQLVIAERKASS